MSGFLLDKNDYGKPQGKWLKIPFCSYVKGINGSLGWNWGSVSSGRVLELLTGQNADTLGVNDPAHGDHIAPLSPTEDQLKQAINDHQPIAATRYTDGFPWDMNPGSPALVPYHVYIVTGIDNGQVTLKNPWGPEGGKFQGTPVDGTVTISLDEFRRRFRDIAIGATP